MEIVEGEATHVVDIPGVNEGLLAKIRDRCSNSHTSTLPPETRTNEKRCIFRLPTRLKNINGKSIEPQVVALGPYHHGKPRLQMMEELKWRWFTYLMESINGKLEECLIELGLLEKEVRECYSESETINLSSDELLQMMLVDGCFILMLFIRTFIQIACPYRDLDLAEAIDLDLDVAKTLPPRLADDLQLDLDVATMFLVDIPIFRLDMVILPKIYRDLLLLENQIPSCVLKTLYRICCNISSNKYSLSYMAMTFLCSTSVIPNSRNMPGSLEWLHLLDLVRLIFISRRSTKVISGTHIRPFNPIPCVTKLCRAGIKVNRYIADTFLDVKFKNGVIKMPDIILDDSMCSLLVNCVAFEQSYNISKYFSNYVTLLDCLVNTTRDVGYLCDCRVIDNFFGNDAEATQFINNLGKDLTIIYKDRGDNDDFFLLDVFGDVNEYYRKRLNWGNWQWTSNWQWNSFKREYFGRPWLLISALVGFVLLVLTYLQTHYTICDHVHPTN